MLPVPAAVASGIVLLSVHASLAEWDLEGLSTAWMRWIEKGFNKPDSQEQRMEDALQKMMMENYRRAIRYVAHFVGGPGAVCPVPDAAAAGLCHCSPVCGGLGALCLHLVGGKIAPHLQHVSTADGVVTCRSHRLYHQHALCRGGRLQLLLGCLGGLSCVWGCCHSRPACYDPMSGLGLCGGSCMLLRAGGETPQSSVAFPLWSGCRLGLRMRSLNHGPGVGTKLHQSFIPVGRR